MNPSSRLNYISLKNKIPLSVTFEITYDCPLSCLHCYLPETKGEKKEKKYLSLKDILKILRMFKKAGTMSVAFTGGEPLLRKDLPQICAAAKKLNMDFTIYTSLICADEETLKNLKKNGLKKMEVSLYGDKKEHEAVTAMKDSYDMTFKNLILAGKLGFKIKLKTPLTGLNPQGPYKVKKIAENLGFSFSADPMLTLRNDGKELPYYVKAEKKDLKRLILSDCFDIAENISPYSDKENLPLCSAGFNTAAVNPYGILYPCVQLPYALGDLKKNTFFQIWKSGKAEEIRKKLYIKPKKCINCNLSRYCSHCPGISYLKGNIFKENKQSCQIALLTSIKKGPKTL
ncbi:MAG: radical SAM protein [Elusimicrobiota bacterium]